MATVIGIDLGTTNSVVAHLAAGKPQVMQNAEGQKTTPSVVLYREDGDVVVGDLAKRQRLMYAQRTVSSVKRFVGCRWDETEDRRRGVEYELVPTSDGRVAVRVNDSTLLPEEVQAEVLRKMRRTAEDYLGEPVCQAVITCPAYFNDSQRQATKRAAELAGLEALRIINEPTAAALAYGLGKRQKGTGENERIAVFDFGGGTFDISILDINDDVFEVLATCGDTFLGGDRIDRCLMDWLVEQIKDQHGIDISSEKQSMSRIAETAEKVKCELSTLTTTSISLPFICADASGPKHFQIDLTRTAFEELIAPILDDLAAPCRQALSDAGLKPEQLNAVLLVGGSTRIPIVQRLVRDLFKQEPDRSVNPDEAVAIGAAIQGGIMHGELDEILLLDVTPLSLGIELAGGVFSPLIPRNSNIPTVAKKKFTTVVDNQTAVQVHVLQGERKDSRENRTLGRFRLEGISAAPREVPEIEVSFSIDANGILNVAAMDLTTGTMQQVTIEAYAPRIDGDTERMIHDAEAKLDVDRMFQRKTAVRQRITEMHADLMQQLLTKGHGSLSEDIERRLKEALFRLDIALTGSEWASIESAERDVRSVFTEITMMTGGIVSAAVEDMIFESDSMDARK
jgi:molecular chaperone DnaK